MPDHSSSAGDADSSGGLWPAIRKLFLLDGGERSLRAELEEKLDEADEDEAAGGDGESSEDGDLRPLERQMLRNMLHFSELDADDVAIPRSAIIALNAEAKWSEVVATFAEHGHSRLPVYRDQLDSVIGMLHIKDVFAILAGTLPPPEDWTVLLRQPLYVPQSRSALDVLADMRGQRVHMAIVLDEFSGTDGMITIEDLVEEIVGDIADEHDDAPEELIVPISEGLWECDARAELDDVASRIDPRLGEVAEAVDTLGGLTYVLAEQVPPVGACVPHPSGWQIEVIEGDETHVIRLRLHAPVLEELG
ncbi:hemolysin family protein [Qipengyuania sediminis]|uniref:hemolysin family protein n=1 Tax=Qipengyuania sediminis TaxID=1532023 RepID=UPI00105AA339|nr:hemolysin family protein [Qipengyuania sediminis]